MAGRFTVSAVFKAIDRFSRPLAKMQRRTRRFVAGFRRGLKRINGALNGVLAGVKRIGLAAGVAGAAVLAVAKNIAGVGAGFEQAITDVGAVSLKTREEIANLEAAAKQLGATTKFTATEVAAGMEIMAKAGFAESDILVGIEANLSAAAASGMELAEVSDHVTKVLKGMGLDTKEAARVADVLALASSRTNSTIGTLGESMRNVSATARKLGIPLEEVVASVALLQDVGLDASVAGSAMNTMLTKLSKPTAEITRQMKEAKVSFQDAEGNMLPLREVLANMSKVAKESGGNMAQMAFFADLVGLRGQKAAVNLQDLLMSGRIDELTEALEKAGGSAKKMADLRMDTLTGDLTLLESAVDAVKVRVFDLKGGPLRGVVKGMKDWVDKNGEFQALMMAGHIQKITEALPEIVKWLKRIGIAVAAIWALNLAIKVVNITLAIYEGAAAAASVVQKILTSDVVKNSAAWVWNTLKIIANTVASWAVTAAKYAQAAATKLATLMTKRLTLAMIAHTLKTWLSTAATWAYQTAQLAANKVIKAARGLVKALMGIEIAATAKRWLSVTATWAQNTAQLAYNVTTRAAAKAMLAYKTAVMGAGAASAAASGGFLAVMIPLVAIAAAIGAIYLALKQIRSLEKETGGLGIVGTIGEMWKKGTLDPFKAVDAVMNERARAAQRQREKSGGGAKTASRKPAVQPTGTGTGERHTAEAEGPTATLLIKDETGRAVVPKQPRRGLRLNVEPTGAFV